MRTEALPDGQVGRTDVVIGMAADKIFFVGSLMDLVTLITVKLIANEMGRDSFGNAIMMSGARLRQAAAPLCTIMA